MKDCLYVPQIRRTLVSVSKLDELGYSILYRNKVIVKLNNKFVTIGFEQDGLYYLTPSCDTIACVENNVNDNLISIKRKRDDIIPIYLWHLRLGHINVDRIN